jgi:hypothetical protein
MKLRVTGRPGELAERANELHALVDRLIDIDLRKAGDIDTVLDIPALQQGVDRARRQTDRIRRLMLARLSQVIDGAAHASTD